MRVLVLVLVGAFGALRAMKGNANFDTESKASVKTVDTMGTAGTVDTMITSVELITPPPSPVDSLANSIDLNEIPDSQVENSSTQSVISDSEIYLLEDQLLKEC